MDEPRDPSVRSSAAGTSADFSTVTRSRGWNGAFALAASAVLFAISAGTLVMAYVLEWEVPMSLSAVMGVLAFLGIWFFVQQVRGIRRGREWEFRVDATALRWFERDDRTERIDGEIPLRDVVALICRNADGEPPVSFGIQFRDGTQGRIPAFHLDTRAKIDAFVSYWTRVHRDIPIEDPEECLVRR